MDLQFQPGSSSLAVRNVGADVEQKGDGEETRSYSGRSAGGKLRTLRKSSKKATPYDRPMSGRHATAGGFPTSFGSTASSSSLTFRFLGSASRLIASSASYLFPSLFGRRIHSLTQNNSVSVQEAVVEEEDKEDKAEPFTNQKTEVMNINTTDSGHEQLFTVVGSEKPEKRVFDLARVEDMLKQKSWSREQVSRLTDLLNTRLTEHSPTCSRLAEAGFQSSDAGAQAVDLTPRRGEENMASPISEAQRWREELKQARTDCAPVEVARAYMGERTSLQSSLAWSFRGTCHQMDRVAELQPPPGLGLAEDRYRSLPVLRSRARGPAPHLPKKGPILDEEWMSVGPVRRTRHKMFHMNSSPYARALPSVDSLVPRTGMSPPVQSSQTARKILDTLELLSPSPNSKYVNEEHRLVATPDMLNVQRGRHMHRTESFNFSGLRDRHPSNGRLEFCSPSNSSVPTTGTKKESYIEDKSLVNRLLSSNEAGLFSGTTSLMSSSLANSSSSILSSSSDPTFIQPESKPLFAFTFPPFKPEISSTPTGSTFEVAAAARSPELNELPPTLMTSAHALSKAEAPSLTFPGKEEQLGTVGLSMGPDARIKESNSVDTEQKLTSFQRGFPSFKSPFAFKMAPSNSPFGAKGLETASTKDGESGAQSESAIFSLQKSGVSVSPFVFSSTPAECSVTMTATNAPASFGSSVFGSLSGSSPVFKSSHSSELFGASSIAKPVVITPLAIGASNAPFSFSPPPALVSCSTPTFLLGGKAGVVNVSSEASLSKLEDTNSAPVFDFTSPSGSSKVSVVASEDISLPAPRFMFGAGASPCTSGDTITRSGPIFSFGVGESPPSGGLVAELASMTSSFLTSGQGIGSRGATGSQQSFKFVGESTSEQLVGSFTGSASPVPFSTAENLQAPAGLEAPVSRSSGLEKSGRRFIKAKRKK